MKNKGITLIALVITIVVLIILAGVTINLTLGENGIFKKAEEAREKELEGAAREKLELVLVEASIEKQSNASYNKDEFLNEILEKNGITVNGDTVIVDNFVYEIDREKLKIGQSLGQTTITVTTALKSFLGLNADSKYEVSKLIKVESNNGLQSVVLKKSDGTTQEITVEEAITGKEIAMELDEKYELIVTSNGGKTESRIIVEKSVENIRTPEELVSFRDKVNTGLTYEGKTINVVANLDLSSVCGETKGSWEPIGNYGTDTTHIFKGTFDGNNHTIDNLYINTTSYYQGLFGYVQNGTITGVVIGKNSEITANSIIGGIVANSESSKISECGNNATIFGNEYAGGIVGTTIGSQIIGVNNNGDLIVEGSCVGGIAASQGKAGDTSFNKILYSYNTGDIIGGSYVGGICGECSDYSRIYNCYNKGNITINIANTTVAYLGGITGRLRAYGEIQYSYNLGTVTNKDTQSYTGGIVGSNTASDGSTIISQRASKTLYSYNSGNINSKGKYTGGIVGRNYQYCIAKNNYVGSGVTVQYNSTAVTTNIGSTSNYVGKIIGNAYSTSTTYVDGNGILTEMPTVYHVVNGLNSGESEYWSNTNLNEPKLKWEK